MLSIYMYILVTFCYKWEEIKNYYYRDYKVKCKNNINNIKEIKEMYIFGRFSDSSKW